MGIPQSDHNAIFSTSTRGSFAYNARLLNDDVMAIEFPYWRRREFSKLHTPANK